MANAVHHEENHDLKKQIWKTFWILFGITLLDIALYFLMPQSLGRNLIFVVLGILKAVYIVGIFMHLKFEKLNLILIIVLPMAFILFFVWLMFYEGGKWSAM